MNELADARLIKLPKHAGANGDGVLVVAEAAEQVPFQIQRMFTIFAPPGAKRGRHAHRLCSQFMICIKGAVEVVCDDGADRKAFSLDSGELALLVPPELWVEINVRQNDAILVVLCDRVYEQRDYIRDYAEFVAFRKTPRA
jgi:dTDP-4-dehydrorhamnose 3,5-epimerase-like enzyme